MKKGLIFCLAFIFCFACILNAGIFDAVMNAASNEAEKAVKNTVSEKVKEAVSEPTEEEQTEETTDTGSKEEKTEVSEDTETETKPEPSANKKAVTKTINTLKYSNDTGFEDCTGMIDAIKKKTAEIKWQKINFMYCNAVDTNGDISVTVSFCPTGKEFKIQSETDAFTTGMQSRQPDVITFCYSKYPFIVMVIATTKNKKLFDKVSTAVQSILPGGVACKEVK